MAKYLIKCPHCKKERIYKPFGDLPKSRAQLKCLSCLRKHGVKTNIIKEM